MRQTRSECARQTDNLATRFLNLFQLPAATQAQSHALLLSSKQTAHSTAALIVPLDLNPGLVSDCDGTAPRLIISLINHTN